MKVIRCFSALLVVILLCASGILAQSRRPGFGRPPTVVRDETGREADVLRKDQVKPTSGDPVTAAVTKQAIEDFMQIQKLGRLMQELSKKEPVELERVAGAAKELNSRAGRLKASLLLPPPPKEDVNASARAASNAELSAQINELNSNIRAFVTNPRFRNLQSAKDPEADARDASLSLGLVIEISRAINRRADQLRRIATR
jgi:hypothetical protein